MMYQQTDAASAEDVQVTPEELARALAAIETRRHSGLDRSIDTIALGEAIRQLGLDVTAEDLLAEVRSQREAAEQFRSAHETARRKRRQRLLAFIPAVLAALVAVALVSLIASRPAPVYHGAIVSMVQPRVIPESAPVQALLTIGQSRDVSLETLYELAAGKSPAEVRLDHGTSRHWQLVPLDGKLYVRVWTHSEPGRGTIRVYTDPLDVTWSPDQGVGSAAGSQYRPLTVPISRFAGVRDPVQIVRASRYGFPIEGVDIPAQ